MNAWEEGPPLPRPHLEEAGKPHQCPRRGKRAAYADDSLTPCSDMETLQRKEDIVSTFAMIFGFDISIKN